MFDGYEVTKPKEINRKTTRLSKTINPAKIIKNFNPDDATIKN